MKNIVEKTCAGVYIFEGIDNVGKTTIVKKVKEKICNTSDYNCANIAFPGNEPKTIGSLVYDIHHNQEKYFNLPLNEVSLQLLHIAAHIDVFHRRWKELGDSNTITLFDRFWWSTYVYGITEGLGENLIQKIIAPEILFWKNINIKQIFLIERENRVHDYGKEKEENIVRIYRKLVKEEIKSKIINNDGDIEDVVAKIYNCIIGEETHETRDFKANASI